MSDSRYGLTVLEGPRICGSGRNKGIEQYKIQWTDPRPNGQPYRPEWLNTEDIGTNDILRYHKDQQPTHSSFASSPVISRSPGLDDHEHLNKPINPKPTTTTRRSPCEDAALEWDTRPITHNAYTFPCDSGAHKERYYICTACAGREITPCCSPPLRSHIQAEHGHHTICRICADGLRAAEGVPQETLDHEACTCAEDAEEAGEYWCLRCHLDRYAKRARKKSNDTVCFCGKLVDQDVARQCSGCGMLGIKKDWN
ncbi:hypothetical protein BDV97DRAFT_348423 [Delphinella strobiligena]|nr:hypothetical protein BDV97DRAFT_348423 [Delphinella strobiligena]